MIEAREPIPFGKAPDGEENHLLTISNGTLSANIIRWGASVQDLRLAGHDFPLVLGFDKFEHYLKYSRYFGATVGRCANRIKGGSFKIDGVGFHTTVNEEARGNTLHGANALSHRCWDLVGFDESSVRLKITDKDGNNGFPGNCNIEATFSISAENALRIEYVATSDLATPINIAHHSYFNLNGGGDVLGHKVQILADHYLPVDEMLIPTGEIKDVSGTPFDFREPTKIGEAGGKDFLHDHNFCLTGVEKNFRDIALIVGDQSGVSMQVKSTEIGLQFFTAKGLEVPVDGLEGRRYRSYAGMCLEAQKWPDGINKDAFPKVIVRPGERYFQQTEYLFKK